jgi:hypothetical protein
MPQAIYLTGSGGGLTLGNGVYQLQAPGNPNSRTDALLTSTSTTGVDSVAVGSMYTDSASGTVYFKTASVNAGNPSGTWTALTIP